MADKKITDLTGLTTPASGDLFAIVDSSEAAAADKNKSITFANIHRLLPAGSAGSPALSFIDDSSVTGLYRSAANELGFAANSTYQGAFTTSGLKLGTGTEAAQLHLFSADTTDQVIIENTDAGVDTAPDLVLYRNSATPAASDNLGNIEFRGEDDGGNAHTYAQIIAGIQTVTDGSEDGYLDLMSSASGTTASRLRLYNQYVGVGELTPGYPLHLTTSLTGTAFRSECNADDAASGGDITMFHRRGVSGAGQDADILGTLYYRGKNDNATPAEVDYAAIEGSIVDASDGTEDGNLKFFVQTAGTLTNQFQISGNVLSIPNVQTFANNTDATAGGLSAGNVYRKSDGTLMIAF